MLGHVRIETTQTHAQIRPAQVKRAVEFYEGKARGSCVPVNTQSIP